MVTSLTSNISALRTQQNLQSVNERIAASTTRLSSGTRVFGAEEDAAALGVGASLSVEIASLRAASLNASNGISLLQVADGALSNITDIGQRLQSLAAQSASGQFSDLERGIIDQEFQALISEIDRIANDTSFDGQDLLTGGTLFDTTFASGIQAFGFGAIEVDNSNVTGDASFRIEYDATEEAIRVSRTDGGATDVQVVDVTALLNDVAGVGQNLTTGENVRIAFSGVGINLTLDSNFDRGVDLSPSLVDNSGAAILLTPALNAVTGVDETVTNNTNGVTDAAVNALVALGAGTAYNAGGGILTAGITSLGGAVTLDGISGIRFNVNGAGIGANGAASDNLIGTPTTVEVFVETATGPELLQTLRFDDVATSPLDSTGNLQLNVGTGLFSAEDTGNAGDIELNFLVGSGVNVNEDFVNVSLTPLTANALGITALSVATQNGANTAVDTISSVLATVNQERAELGANQSRLEFTFNQIQNDLENLISARSNILDVDIAQEITALTSDQALSELSINILSRINAQSQQILQLLQ